MFSLFLCIFSLGLTLKITNNNVINKMLEFPKTSNRCEKSRERQ